MSVSRRRGKREYHGSVLSADVWGSWKRGMSTERLLTESEGAIDHSGSYKLGGRGVTAERGVLLTIWTKDSTLFRSQLSIREVSKDWGSAIDGHWLGSYGIEVSGGPSYGPNGEFSKTVALGEVGREANC